MALTEAASLGWRLLAGVTAGTAGGFLLDRYLGTKPWFTLSLAILGAAAGLFGLARAARVGSR